MVSESLTFDEKTKKSPSSKLFRQDEKPVEWRISEGLVPYPDAVEFMKKQVAGIAAGEMDELVWLVEHPPLYTRGTSARDEDLLLPDRFPIFDAGRGGQFTYHGPGQRVAYIMLDLKQRGRDIRAFVQGLEGWIIDSLKACNIVGERRDGRIGVWVKQPERGPNAEGKIAAIGVRVSRWVSVHGISINISPDLSHYDGIVPCGISEHGVTSFEDLGHLVSIAEIDMVLAQAFTSRFGPVYSSS